jgi:ATP-dependent Lhr-like helicase
MRFHPAVEAWFERRFPHGATEAQARGWEAIASGQSTLIAAPTGSGKTLAAFLVCIDRLVRAANEAEVLVPSEARTQVVYVSPLKALGVDIQQNLEAPLREIGVIAEELGYRAPEVRVAVRSGDTEPSARAAMLKRPPDILITTPESLYLLLTAEKSRRMLASARTVIVDEIHAVARDKRGAHLALSLERLQHVVAQPLTRIGLSATQRPIELVAQLLCGMDDLGSARPCTIVDTGHRRALDLAIELPDSELCAVASTEQMNEVMDRIAKHVALRKTTLVFVNTRRLAERAAHMLAERLGEERVAAHHGSLSKERRQRVEARLRAGELRAVVATASLELGIDVGPVELVCQIGSPRSIATLLQRVGRSGHSRFGTPVGRLFPLTRDELVECAAALRAVRAGRLDTLSLHDAPLDILAQQIVAECAAQDGEAPWQEDALYALLKRAAQYAALSRAGFESALELVSTGILTGRGVRAAYVQRDRVNGVLRGRRSARISALTSGGAIPENADYRVIAEPDEMFVGTINEDFAIESMAGDVFLLGSTSWRVRRVERGTVRVVDAQGATPTIPFWLGEAPARTTELSHAVSELRAGVELELARGGEAAASEWLTTEAGLDATAAGEIAAYLAVTRTALGLLPTCTDLVVERFFDETGGMQLVVHSPLGGRVNRALGLLLRKRFCTSFDFELQAAANDDAVVLSLGPQHSFPLADTPGFLRPPGARESLVHAVIVTPMFAVRWRWNLNRALVVLRMKSGKKNPPPIQRMEADDVMVAVFPALAACQDNATGPREIPDHVLVRQTLEDCMHEAMDIEGLEALLAAIRDGSVRMHYRDTTEPSPLSHEILNGRPYTYLDDAPLEERRTRAIQTRRGLPVAARELAALDPSAIDRVRAEAEPAPRDASELHDVLSELYAVAPRAAWAAFHEELVRDGRALCLQLGEHTLWCALERRAHVEALYPGARFTPDTPLPSALAAAAPLERDQVAIDAVRGHLDIAGPTTPRALAAALGFDATNDTEVSVVLAALAQLELRGVALRGNFDPRGGEPAEPQYCARRLLSRIHAYTHERLRRDIEPVSPQDFMRFLLRFQHVAPGFQLSASAGVLRAVEQLQGYELAAAAWEGEVLAARVDRYKPELLDAACLSGDVCWGRLSERVSLDEASAALSSPSRATPITLALRADQHWLARAMRDPEGQAERDKLPVTTARALSALREHGALFFSELSSLAELPIDLLREALWDGVARGLVTADGFGALRSLLAPSGARAAAHAGVRRVGLRRGAPRAQPGEGRWAIAPHTSLSNPQARDVEELAEAVAEQLLARWGVVFRDLLLRDALCNGAGLPWREIAWALRRLEARGLVRGGRFVSGFVGEQYALPEAVELLRSVRRAPHDGAVVRLSGCDPLNLTGLVLPGPRVPAQRNNHVLLRDGVRLDASASSAQLDRVLS